MAVTWIRPLVDRREFYDMVFQARGLHEGHLLFHDLHHTFYINPAVFFRQENLQIGSRIGALLASSVPPVDWIIAPTNSEVSTFITEFASYFHPKPPVMLLPYLRSFPRSQTSTPYAIDESAKPGLYKKTALVIDTGTVTGESITCIRDSLVRSNVDSIHIFTFFHRKDREWALNLTSLSSLGLTTTYHYLAELFIPVLRSRDCPIDGDYSYLSERRSMFHSRHAQVLIGRLLEQLEGKSPSVVDEDTTDRLEFGSNTSAYDPYLTSFSKFISLNEFFRSRSIENSIALLDSFAVERLSRMVALTHLAHETILTYATPLTDLRPETVASMVDACKAVLRSTHTRADEKWRAIKTLRFILGDQLVHELSWMLNQASIDETIYVALAESIYDMLLVHPHIADEVRQAFAVAHRHIDLEHISRTHDDGIRNEYLRKASVIYDLRQDQVSLLPVGVTEYNLADVLLPLGQYITRSRPGHTPVAKRLDELARGLNQLYESLNHKVSTIQWEMVPRRVRRRVEHWKHEVHDPLVTIRDLFGKLLYRPGEFRPPYLDESTEPNIRRDIETADGIIGRFVAAAAGGQYVPMDDVRRLTIVLRRLYEELFVQNSGSQRLLRQWFVNLRAVLENSHGEFHDRLRERGIEVSMSLDEEVGTVLWYESHAQQAFDNFFGDALKPTLGPFPDGYDGVRNIEIRLRKGREPWLAELGWQDSGQGIPEEVVAEVHGGAADCTLAVVRRRLRRIGGDLEASRLGDRGTIFLLTLVRGDV